MNAIIRQKLIKTEQIHSQKIIKVALNFNLGTGTSDRRHNLVMKMNPY